jgi:deoxyguanosine kinase
MFFFKFSTLNLILKAKFLRKTIIEKARIWYYYDEHIFKGDDNMKTKDGIFIAVEGTIGVGKTTLSSILTKHFEADSLREIVEENPFLSKFYENKEEYALQTESFFLFNRIKQLKDTYRDYLKIGNTVVSDYHIVKNLIFAGLTLTKEDFYKYKQIYNIFVNELPQPDIIVYLHSNTDTLMERIAMRDRSFERQMDRNYIESLNTEYTYYFNPMSIKHNFVGKEPVIIDIDNSDMDFLKNMDDRQIIIDKVQAAYDKIKETREC